MSNLCCMSDNCERKFECANYHKNNPNGFVRDYYYGFGYGSIVNNKPDFWVCGEKGDWATFIPINKEDEMEIPKIPFQYMEAYCLGGMDWDTAMDYTVKETNRLIKQYLEKVLEKENKNK